MKNIVHWNKQKKIWTSHTYLGCEWAPVILIKGPWRTECKPEKVSNPRGWIVSDDKNVILNPPDSLLTDFRKTTQLIYNKDDVSFNIDEGLDNGEALLFDHSGCYLLESNDYYLYEDDPAHQAMTEIMTDANY